MSITNVINGESVPAADGRTSDVVDPSTGKTYDTAPLSGPSDVDAAYAAAEQAFATWRRITPSERQKLLLEFADALEERTEDLVATEVANTGKPVASPATRRSVSASTSCASSPASPGRWRARRPVSTSLATRPTCAVSRSASSARWRRGTTRS